MDIIDLHTHSIFSDGTARPEEYVDEFYRERHFLKIEGLDLKVVALTDHDTMNGIEPLKKAFKKYEDERGIKDRVEVLPGMEISSQINGQEVHMLGYFPGVPLEKIDSVIGVEIQRNMDIRNDFYRIKMMPLLLKLFEQRMLSLGQIPIIPNLDELTERLMDEYELFKDEQFDSKSDSDVIKWSFPFPRSLIRKVLDGVGIPKGVIAKYSSRSDPKKVVESFYLGVNKRSPSPLPESVVRDFARQDIGRYIYSPEITENYMTTQKAVELISSVGGKSFFAHPFEFIGNNGVEFFETYVKGTLIPAGLTGLECFYPDHDSEMVEYLLDFCLSNGLLVSGGTDTHLKRDYERFGVSRVGMKIPYELYSKIVGSG